MYSLIISSKYIFFNNVCISTQCSTTAAKPYPTIASPPNTPKFLLLLDGFSGHVSNNVNDALKDYNCCVEFLPPNTTALLQPLDVLINRTFKSRLRQIAERWRLYQLKYSEIYSDKKKRPSPSKQELAQFILWAWDSIQAKTIRAAFKKAKLIENENELPGEEEENDSKIDVEKYFQYFQPHKPTAKKMKRLFFFFLSFCLFFFFFLGGGD